MNNSDVKIDTPAGKTQPPGTAVAAFQQHVHGRTKRVI